MKELTDILEELMSNNDESDLAHLRKTCSNDGCYCQEIRRKIAQAKSAIGKLFLEWVGEDKYLIDSLPKIVDEHYLAECIRAKDMVDGYNQAKQEIRNRVKEPK